MWRVLEQRALARRQQCKSNAEAIGRAVNSYHMAHGIFPRYMNSELVPFLSTEPTDPRRQRKLAKLGSLRCPSDTLAIEKSYAFSYVWNRGQGFSEAGDGFVPNDLGLPLKSSDFTDGLSNTAASSETLIFDMESPETCRKLWSIGSKYPRKGERTARPEDRLRFRDDCLNVPMNDDHMSYSHRGTESGSMEWYFHLLVPNQPSCETTGVSEAVTIEVFTANSAHPGGVHLLMVDGAVRFVSDGIDHKVWTALGTRNGNETIDW